MATLRLNSGSGFVGKQVSPRKRRPATLPVLPQAGVQAGAAAGAAPEGEARAEENKTAQQGSVGPGTWCGRAALPAWTAHFCLKKYTANLFEPLLLKVFLLFTAKPNPTQHNAQMEGLLKSSMGPIPHHIKRIKMSYMKYKLQITLQGMLRSSYLVSIIYTL